MKLGISLQDLQDFIFVKTWFEAKDYEQQQSKANPKLGMKFLWGQI
jgi:hypothetical protein